MNDMNTKWCENIIVVDADFVDRVAFDLIVNFERMLGRRIPQADLARWLECIALDGGLREGQHETSVALIHDKGKQRLQNFSPGNYEDELSAKAFSSFLGEFVINSVPVEPITTKEDMIVDVTMFVASQPNVKRIMVVPDDRTTELFDRLRRSLQQVDDEKRITLFAMQPLPGGNYRQEILGYSLMSALGIKSEELSGTKG